VTLALSDPLVAPLVVAARARWPGIELADDAFVPYLAARLPDDAPAGDALRVLCVEDLWLACAVARGEPAALRAFEDHCLRDVEPAISHLDGGSALASDVRDAVRERVLPASAGGQNKIADYRGRGDLRGWLRVVAVREALQLLRARRRETPIADGDHTLAARLDEAVPVTAMTDTERQAYREAFATALATLSPRERNLLRQQYLYGASVDELAALYSVHRATAARWVARIRELVLRRTRRQLGEVLRLSGDELDSVMGRLADHLDYSLRQTLSFET
jgi:RNA polymerase sigma-70 factor (ECF subfamily)